MSTYIPTVITPLPVPPVSAVTPFTYRDLITFLDILYGLAKYTAAISAELDEKIAQLIADVNASLEAQAELVNTALENQVIYVNSEIADMKAYVDAAVESIINSTIEVSDPVILGVISNANSDSNNYIEGMIRDGQGVTNVVHPTMTPAQVQAVINATPAGAKIVFAPGTYPTPTDGFVFPNNSVQVDTTRAKITSATWGRPAFDLIGRSSMVLDLGAFEFIGARGVATGSAWRGSAPYVSTAAVWSNGSFNTIRGLRSDKYVTAIFLAAWNGTSTYDIYNDGNQIFNVEASHHNFGVLWVGQRDLYINGLYVHDDLDDSLGVNPTHALYGSSTTTFRDTVVTVANLRCERNLAGHAYQMKYTDRLTISDVTAVDCAGILSVIDCHDMKINGVQSTEDRGGLTGSTFSFLMQTGTLTSQRPQVSDVSITLKDNVNNKGFLLISDDGTYNDLTVNTKYTGVQPDSSCGIDIRGINNMLDSAKVNHKGTVGHGILFSAAAPFNTGLTILNPVIRGASHGIRGYSVGATDVRISYDAALQQTTVADLTVANGIDYSVAGVPPRSLSVMGENAVLHMLAKDSPVHYGANGGVQVKVRPTQDIAVSNLYWWSVVANGNYDIAIYDDVVGTKLWSKGSSPWPAAGLITETVTGVTLRAGRSYRFSFSADNATGSYRGITPAATGLDRILATGLFVATQVASIFPLPSTLVAGSAAATNVPLIVAAGVKP